MSCIFASFTLSVLACLADVDFEHNLTHVDDAMDDKVGNITKRNIESQSSTVYKVPQTINHQIRLPWISNNENLYGRNIAPILVQHSDDQENQDTLISKEVKSIANTPGLHEFQPVQPIESKEPENIQLQSTSQIDSNVHPNIYRSITVNPKSNIHELQSVLPMESQESENSQLQPTSQIESNFHPNSYRFKDNLPISTYTPGFHNFQQSLPVETNRPHLYQSELNSHIKSYEPSYQQYQQNSPISTYNPSIMTTYSHHIQNANVQPDLEFKETSPMNNNLFKFNRFNSLPIKEESPELLNNDIKSHRSIQTYQNTNEDISSETIKPISDFSETKHTSTYAETYPLNALKTIAQSQFDDRDFENCEFDESDTAPMFSDRYDPTMYITCASYGVPVKLPCPRSTFFDDALKTCVPEGFVDSSCGSRCSNGECIFDEQNSKYICRCNVGYTGLNCTDKIDYCKQYEDKCGSGKCINQVGTYVCDCGYGMVGQSCEDAKQVPCSNQFVHEGGRLDKRTYHPFGTDQTAYITCFSKDSFVVRRCKEDQFWDQSSLACVNMKPREVKPGCEQYPCLAGGQCITDYNSTDKYKCQCASGYYGKNCEFVVDHCKPNPCSGYPCISVANPPGYICECANKVYDDCCCNDISNRCDIKTKREFYAEKNGMFVHCTPDGRAFVKKCPEGYGFEEMKLTCVKYYRIRGTAQRNQILSKRSGEAEFANETDLSATELKYNETDGDSID